MSWYWSFYIDILSYSVFTFILHSQTFFLNVQLFYWIIAFSIGFHLCICFTFRNSCYPYVKYFLLCSIIVTFFCYWIVSSTGDHSQVSPDSLKGTELTSSAPVTNLKEARWWDVSDLEQWLTNQRKIIQGVLPSNERDVPYKNVSTLWDTTHWSKLCGHLWNLAESENKDH